MVNMSVSMPGETFGSVSEFQSKHGYKSFSQAAARLLKWGLIYEKILKEQEVVDAAEKQLRKSREVSK